MIRSGGMGATLFYGSGILVLAAVIPGATLACWSPGVA